MADTPCTEAESGREWRPGGGRLFWVLIALAAAAFAPCVILPVWRDYQAVRLLEQRKQAEVRQARAEVSRQRRLAEALRSDPALIARVAQRELDYRRPGEVRIAVRAEAARAADEASPLPLEPVEPPPAVRRWLAWLPDRNYDAIFCDDSTRTVIMILAGGLVAAAFILFPPYRPTRSRPAPE